MLSIIEKFQGSTSENQNANNQKRKIMYNEEQPVDNVCKAVYDQLKCNYTPKDKIRIISPEDVLKIKNVALMSDLTQEHFNIITLTTGCEMIKFHNITKGLLNHSLVHPREVFRSAIKDNAHSFIAVHNHPSGNTEPSNQDLEVTKQLTESGKILGINLLDHIIVTKSGITSLRSLGYM